jgi:peptidoglycan/LPS O-acetylase OafA/YrhL
MSGFLVTKSFDERRNIFLFAEARFLRIVPALAGVALFCVLIVGPCYTSLPLADFFWNSHTFRFLYTHMTVHRIEIELPGVFTRNIFPNAVNGSLWTLAYEISMYKWVAFLGLISVIRRRFTFSILFIAWVLICLFVPPAYLVHNIQMRSLSFAFFSGAFFYVNRESIPLTLPGLLGLLAVAASLYSTEYYGFAVEAALAYGSLWFAYIPSGPIRLYNKVEDYSYGLYVYAFPVQQSIAATIKGIGPISMFFIALVVALFLAFLSWHFIEKPTLRLKGKLALALWTILKKGKCLCRSDRVSQVVAACCALSNRHKIT